MTPRPPRPSEAPAFTLLELLVSVAVLGLLFVFLAEVTQQVRDVTQGATRRIETFKETRAAFEAMARRIGQASLNSYWGYDNPENPRFWLRQSELHFVATPADPVLSTPENPTAGHCVFFQAPFGYAGTEAKTDGDGRLDYLDGLLNGWGYYIEYNSDLPDRTPFLGGETQVHPERKRLRLMEVRIPAEDLVVMKPDIDGGGGASGSINGLPEIATFASAASIYQWFSTTEVRDLAARPIAENVLALIISPQIPDDTDLFDGLEPVADFRYDSRLHQYQSGHPDAPLSRHQLPPAVDVTLVATDERSWQLFEALHGSDAAADLISEINTRFSLVTDYETDLEELEEWMLERKLAPRIFRTTISIRASKFTTERDQ